MTRALPAALAAAALGLSACASLADPPGAGTRFYAYDPASPLSRHMTRGVTLEVERGLLGGARVVRFYATAATGSAALDHDAASGAVRAALPAGASESNAYLIQAEGQGGALARALCPAATRTWLVMGRVRPGEDLRMHAVGETADGGARLCASLDYTYRGEFARPTPREAGERDEPIPGGG